MKTFGALTGAIGLFLVVQSIDPLGFQDILYYFRAAGFGMVAVFFSVLLEKGEL